MRDNIKLIYIVLVFMVFTSLSAQMSIDAQIQNIKNAPAAKRVEMMNALKMQLSTMNSHDRTATITKMRSEISSRSHSTKSIEKQRDHGRDQINEHTQNSQSDSMQQMDTMERMNQTHASEEYIHEEYINNSMINNEMLPIPDNTHPQEINDWIKH